MTMKVYLVQHGLSLSEDVDPKRSLSEEGKAQTLKVARFLKEKKLKVDLIWHSQKERSIQTAQIFLEHLASAEMVSRDDLNPLDSVDKFSQELQALNKDLMIVGHLPFLQKLASKLLLGSTDFVVSESQFRYNTGKVWRGAGTPPGEGRRKFFQAGTGKISTRGASAPMEDSAERSEDYLELISFRNSSPICLEYRDGWKLLWIVNPDLV